MKRVIVLLITGIALVAGMKQTPADKQLMNLIKEANKKYKNIPVFKPTLSKKFYKK